VDYDDDVSQDDEAGSPSKASIVTEDALKYVNTQGEAVGNKPNPRFKN
jgi:hypothetical protein